MMSIFYQVGVFAVKSMPQQLTAHESLVLSLPFQVEWNNECQMCLLKQSAKYQNNFALKNRFHSELYGG